MKADNLFAYKNIEFLITAIFYLIKHLFIGIYFIFELYILLINFSLRKIKIIN